MKDLIFVVAIASSVLMITGCGTDTGNPISRDPRNYAGQTPEDPTFSGGLKRLICQKIMECFPESKNLICGQHIDRFAHLTDRLGLNPADFASYKEIYQAESDGRISPRSRSSGACYYNISVLTCDNKYLQQSYLVDHPESPYFNVDQLLSPACLDAFE